MKVIGHRGARGLAPENTIASLQKALEHHVDAVEFDLRVTADSVVVLHHDPELADQSSAKFKISDYTYAALREHKPDLATFDEALQSIGSQTALVVEVKPDEPIKPIVTIIKKYLARNTAAKLSLASFSQKTLLELHAALPGVEKIVIEKWSGVRAGRRMRQLGTKTAFMNQRWLWWGFIRSVSRGGWQLYPYTLNDPAKARRWARWGLAGVITDYPDLFEK